MELQSEFVNRVEAFHQQVYAVISSFINLLIKIAPSKFKNHIPKWSVSKFLDYLEKIEPLFTNDVILLLRSEEVRNKCIDHPQNQPRSFTWQTGTFVSKTYVIYYIHDEAGQQHDISSQVRVLFKLMTTFKAKTFYVTPHHADVFTALCRLMENTLDRFSR